eukprot:5760438-Pleurochrysis_carterae.AAC.1
MEERERERGRGVRACVCGCKRKKKKRRRGGERAPSSSRIFSQICRPFCCMYALNFISWPGFMPAHGRTKRATRNSCSSCPSRAEAQRRANLHCERSPEA